MDYVVLLSGAHKGRRIVLSQERMLIGSDPACAIHLSQPSVHGRHASLERTEQGTMIHAVSSAAPLLVNQRLVSRHRLMAGDEFDIGDERFLFQSVADNPAVRSRPHGVFARLSGFAIALIVIAQALLVLGLLIYWRWDAIPGTAERSSLDLRDPGVLSARINAWLGGDSAWHNDPGQRPVPFSILPQWIVTPYWYGGPDLLVASDERGASDSSLSRE